MPETPQRSGIEGSGRASPPSPFFTEILDRIGEGIVVVNEVGTPVQANSMALGLLGVPEGPLPARLPLHELDQLLRSAVTTGEPVTSVIEVRVPERRALSIRVAPLTESNRAVLVLRDVTEESRTMQLRRQFVAHASHELKSPVASLQTLAEAVDRAIDDDPEATRSLIARMTGEAERLGRLVKGLLDLSRLEEPGAISNRTADVSAIVHAQVDSLTELAETKSIEIRLDVTPGVQVAGDGSQLGLMVRNLLDNALRYTPEEGRVSVTVDKEGNEARIVVSDNGVGIPLRHQSRIFERFFRVDDSRSRETGGTGLGLAIVKHVAEIHSGLVRVESELGEGSTFEVVLPTRGTGS